MKDQHGPEWQPIEKLDYVLGLVRGMAEESREQRGLFREAGIATLDQATIVRARHVYADRLDLVAIFREQVERWRKQRPSREQARKMDELQLLLQEDEGISREILGIIGYVPTGHGSAGRGRHVAEN